MAKKKAPAKRPVQNTRGVWDMIGTFFGWR